jgi:hypothetical protein
MKRDMDLVRKLLLKIEEKTDSDLIYEVELEDYDKDLIEYHLELLQDARLIKAYFQNMSDGRRTFNSVERITWKGHEFLDAARDESVWIKAKQKFKEKGESFSLDLMKEILLGVLRSNI